MFSNLNTTSFENKLYILFFFYASFFTGVTSIVKYAPSSYGAGNQIG
jgi:hypothetical protein